MAFDALRRGDVSVLDALLEQHGDELRGVAYLVLRDRSEAEDVVVETLLTALRRGSQLRDAASLRPWLLRICVNQAIDQRRRAARVLHLPLLPVRAVVSPPREERLDLLDALGHLPPRIRATVVLRYYADLPVADVATAMGTSVNTVKSQLREALSRLRVSLTADVPEIAMREVGHA